MPSCFVSIVHIEPAKMCTSSMHWTLTYGYLLETIPDILIYGSSNSKQEKNASNTPHKCISKKFEDDECEEPHFSYVDI